MNIKFRHDWNVEATLALTLFVAVASSFGAEREGVYGFRYFISMSFVTQFKKRCVNVLPHSHIALLFPPAIISIWYCCENCYSLTKFLMKKFSFLLTRVFILRFTHKPCEYGSWREQKAEPEHQRERGEKRWSVVGPTFIQFLSLLL